MCSIILAIVLLITAALSAVALLACRYQFWTFLQDASATPVYTLRCFPSTCMHMRPSKAAFIKVGYRLQRRQHAN